MFHKLFHVLSISCISRKFLAKGTAFGIRGRSHPNSIYFLVLRL